MAASLTEKRPKPSHPRVVSDLDYRMIPFLLATLLQPIAQSPRPIALTVYPRISFAPATIRIQVRMQPIASDRHVRVETDGENFFRATEYSIEGEKAPKLASWTIPDLPSGSYTVVAGIGPWSGYRAQDRTIIEVR